MNIGQASKQSGISSKMIRYYEKIGVLDTAKRSNSDYRMYSKEDVEDLSFLRHARDLGFSSKQMKELLYLRKNTNRQSADVKQLTQEHIDTLNQKIAQLQEMVDALQNSFDNCAGDDNADCAILEDIGQG
ncbi:MULTISPECIES: Cu(I)-responsive transcriptional regulator [unclassified Psychrobacter]|uniref:Cu(I)-responsive transcriptional regulator n=1 Tax=unclassified Psychrobacter TaxID=196806 RepID=UPI00178793DD|nr:MULTISPECIES: Cu(I)-responsive transcriptional regulator [unclassified Psychrobacter]MBE0442863.1 Cu(I)-responsive transcriptional regulator [Psychrobacter sp. FME13]